MNDLQAKSEYLSQETGLDIGHCRGLLNAAGISPLALLDFILKLGNLSHGRKRKLLKQVQYTAKAFRVPGGKT